MAKRKTNELTGAALDWAVAKCEGKGFVFGETDYTDGHTYQRGTAQSTGPHYSADWAQGGPIIDRERISVGDQTHIEGQPEHSAWYATNRKGAYGLGPTLLIAAMRCYVTSKLGLEVDVPDELI